MIGPKAEAMNEEMDREWGPEAVLLWNEWIDFSEAERDIQKSRPEYVENYMAWKEQVERVCKERQEKWVACQAAIAEYRKRNGLPPFPFCPR